MLLCLWLSTKLPTVSQYVVPIQLACERFLWKARNLAHHPFLDYIPLYLTIWNCQFLPRILCLNIFIISLSNFSLTWKSLLVYIIIPLNLYSTCIYMQSVVIFSPVSCPYPKPDGWKFSRNIVDLFLGIDYILPNIVLDINFLMVVCLPPDLENHQLRYTYQLAYDKVPITPVNFTS